jgi:hypothetical protein
VIIHRGRLQAEGPMRFTSSALSIRAESVCRGAWAQALGAGPCGRQNGPIPAGARQRRSRHRSAISDQAAIQKNKDQ